MKKYYTNPETSELEEISEQCWKMMQHFKTVKREGVVGHIFITGTAGEINNINDYTELFYNGKINN